MTHTLFIFTAFQNCGFCFGFRLFYPGKNFECQYLSHVPGKKGFRPEGVSLLEGL